MRKRFATIVLALGLAGAAFAQNLDMAVATVTSGSSDAQAVAAPTHGEHLRLCGWSAAESASPAAAASFILRDGTSSAGAVVVTVSLSAGESAREWYAPYCIPLASGLYLDRTAGSTVVTVYTRATP